MPICPMEGCEASVSFTHREGRLVFMPSVPWTDVSLLHHSFSVKKEWCLWSPTYEGMASLPVLLFLLGLLRLFVLFPFIKMSSALNIYFTHHILEQKTF